MNDVVQLLMSLGMDALILIQDENVMLMLTGWEIFLSHPWQPQRVKQQVLRDEVEKAVQEEEDHELEGEQVPQGAPIQA